ncbi:hypothetical protein QQM79_20080 [Marinobacteraceae bacterium S3BR75-40.1]
MKDTLRNLFWPILKHFEGGEPGAHYKASYRTILNVLGSLFLFLGIASLIFLTVTGLLAALFPALAFLGIGVVALIVGTLGSDAAVARIWRNR